MTPPLHIGGLTLAPGTKGHGLLSLPDFFADGQAMEIPFLAIHGAHPGKTLYVQAAQHGDEVMGLDAVRRLVAELDPASLRGTFLFCLPNPLAFREQKRATLFDPRPGGMNRIWPGNPDGSLTERMADLVWRELASRADAVVDLHTATRHCPVWLFYEPEGVSNSTSPETVRRSERMARLFGTPVIYVQTEPYGDRKTLRARCVDAGIPAIVPELGAAGFFDPAIIEIGRQGLLNILCDLGILEGEPILPPRQVKLRWVSDHTRFTAAAPVGGVFLPQVSVGDLVKKGDPLGLLYSPRSFETLATLRSPTDGFVFSIRENPVAHAGDVLVAIPEILEWLENPATD
jgi:predicted deacylase